jgi:phenylacetaldehyde dehydrogenase
MEEALAQTVLENIKPWLAKTRPMLIDGKWRASREDAALDVFNPADGSLLTRIAVAQAADVDAAVAAAKRAHDSGVWRKMLPAERAKILWRIGELIDSHAEELALLETLDNGKPLAFSRTVDLPRAAEVFRYYAGWCTKIEGATPTPSIPGSIHAYTRKEPVGVAALIVPWNFPLTMASAKLAPALAAGCTCVLKPSEQTPLTSLRLGELILEAGVPEGVVNIIPGLGSIAGARLVSHPDVAKIAFTGSTAVGKAIVQAAAQNLPRVTLELGGKSPTIILEDADLDAAIPGAAMSIFFNSGQVCVAGSRLFVARKIFDKVMAGILQVAEALVVGPGIDETTQLGPLVSAQHLARVDGYVKSGIEEGAEMVTGGRSSGTGYFYKPTILARTTANMRVRQEEIFGPVLTAQPFDDIDAVVTEANATTYGLAASVWTRDVKNVHELAAAMDCGLVGVNCAGVSDFSVPFGGYKQSGWGRELGKEGLEGYLETKSVFVSL